MTDPVADAAEVRPPATDADVSAPENDADVQPEKRRSVVGRIGSILLKVVSWFILITCGALIIGFVLIPRLTGSTPYTVLTGSMRPSMPPGTTVVVKPIEFSDIRVGDVITYQIKSGEPDVVTHRVIGINVTTDGVRLETQGDANPAPDPELVREEQVRGKAWYWLPVIGYVTNGVSGDTRTWLAQGLGVGLIAYAVVTLVVVAVKGGKKRGTGDSVDQSGAAESAADDSVTSEDADGGAEPDANRDANDAQWIYPAEVDAGTNTDAGTNNATETGTATGIATDTDTDTDTDTNPSPTPR